MASVQKLRGLVGEHGHPHHVNPCVSACLCVQRSLSREKELLSRIQLEVQEVSGGFVRGLDLDQMRSSLDAVIQQVSAAEALRDHLGTCFCFQKYSLFLL